MPRWSIVPVAAFLGAASAVWFVASIGGMEESSGASHPWEIQIAAERRCVVGVHRSRLLPASFRFRRQGDSAVDGDGWKTSFWFTTTHANGRHLQHTAACEVSLEERRGIATVTTEGEADQESFEFVW
jgi:hypothetical protein